MSVPVGKRGGWFSEGVQWWVSKNAPGPLPPLGAQLPMIQKEIQVKWSHLLHMSNSLFVSFFYHPISVLLNFSSLKDVYFYSTYFFKMVFYFLTLFSLASTFITPLKSSCQSLRWPPNCSYLQFLLQLAFSILSKTWHCYFHIFETHSSFGFQDSTFLWFTLGAPFSSVSCKCWPCWRVFLIVFYEHYLDSIWINSSLILQHNLFQALSSRAFLAPALQICFFNDYWTTPSSESLNPWNAVSHKPSSCLCLFLLYSLPGSQW